MFLQCIYSGVSKVLQNVDYVVMFPGHAVFLTLLQSDTTLVKAETNYSQQNINSCV